MDSRPGATIRRRTLWLGAGALAAVLVAALGVSLVFRSFQDSTPHDPEAARSVLDDRTAEEVAVSRERVVEIENSPMAGPGADEGVEAEIPQTGAPSIEDQEPGAAPLPGAEDPSIGEAESNTLPVPEEVQVPDSLANVHSPGLPDGMFDAVMLIGADASGFLADSIILLLFPEGGSAPAMVSIPRDLYLYNLCSEDYRRVNVNLGGCPGYANGPELLALAIHEFTGVEVDHYVRVDFNGFVELIDGLGGVGICFEYPTYDEKAGLDVQEPTCHIDGATALAYSRSRNATQLVEGEWRQAWSSDFARQDHQRQLLLQLAGQMQDSSLGTILSTLQGLSHTVRLDGGWSLTEAVEWIWRYRGSDPSQVSQIRIPVEDYRTTEGAQVLIPTRSFNDILSGWWGPARR